MAAALAAGLSTETTTPMRRRRRIGWQKVRRGRRLGGLHAGLIYARRPATSDKSLTPRHYLFALACARVRSLAHVSFKSSRENDTSAMNIKRTPTQPTCRHRHYLVARAGPTRILYEALFTRARSTLTPTRTSAGPPGETRRNRPTRREDTGAGEERAPRNGGEPRCCRCTGLTSPSKSENSARKEVR